MVDFTKKIINSNKFRGPAIRFQETGRYCDSPLGTSEFLAYWDEEKRRCLEGYTADDGDYITGYNYFYLNYCPINRQVYKEKIDRHGKKVMKKEQIFEFPDFWDYDYFYFSSVQEAEEQGKHLCVLKSRRRGYSYKAASMMCRNYYLIPASKSYVYASNKQYLTEDGVLTKAWDQMDFIDKHTAWGKKRSVNTAMRKRAGFISKDEYGNEVEMGYKSEIIGVTLKDNPDAGHPYDETVHTPNGIAKWENINIGSTLFDAHGGTCKVTNVFELGNVDVYDVYLNDGRIVQATDDHKWRIYRYGYKKKEGKERKALKEYEVDTKQLLEMLSQRSYSKNPARIKTAPCVEFNSQYTPIDAYTLGLLLGDGCIKKASNHGVPFTQLPSDKGEIEKHVPYKILKTSAKAEVAYSIEIPNAKQIFFDLGLTEKVSVNKFVPDCYKYNSVEVRLGVINGLLDTDGSVTKDCGVIEYVSKSKHLATDMQWLLFSIGIRSSIHIKLINNVPYYRVYIYCRGDETRLFNLPRKKERIAIKKLTPFALSKVEYSQIEKVVYVGKKKSKCVTVDSEDHVYLIKDFVETRNCRGKKANLILFEEAGSFSELAAAWQIARPSVEIDGIAFAPMICYGTGGDKDSNFGALKEMFYNPSGFNCLEFDNIWDDNPGDAKCGFFIPQYTNIDIRDDDGNRLYMDNDGNTFTKKSIEYILAERKKILDVSSNAESIDRYVAERPITPREAMLEFNGNIFPKKEILELLSTIRTHKNLLNHKQIGDLVWDGNGQLHWQMKKVGDITHYPLRNGDDPTGSIVIWEHPKKDASVGLYIAGIDSYDYDSSSTTSLGSCFIYKRILNLEEYSDIIVAEYTGRPATSEEFYENVRKLLIYYNARAMYENQNKGIFVYFTNKHCDYLLADQPDIINDIVGGSKVQRKKGCHMNKLIKQWGEGLIKEWLNDLDSTGKKNVFNVLSEPLLEELLAYSDTANTDRCLRKGSLITTFKGDIPIEEMNVNDLVLTHTGQFKPVTWVDSHESANKKITLKTMGDYQTLVCTDNHPICVAYTDKKTHKFRKSCLYNKAFLRADELNYKYQFTLLPTRKHLKDKKINLSDGMLYTLGWIMADGYLQHNGYGVTITFQKNQLQCAEQCKMHIEEYLSNEPYYYTSRGRRFQRKETVINEYPGYYKLVVHSRKLHTLAERFGCKPNHKCISWDIYNGYGNLMPFVLGWLEGDGHQKRNTNYDGYTRNGIELSTIYEDLIRQCRLIMLDHGIYSSLREIKSKKGHKTQYGILISNEYVRRLMSHYCPELGISSFKFKDITVTKQTGKVLWDEEGCWVPIKLLSVEETVETVYNFEVQDDHTYVANGITTHNCMALMLVMIYREQLYNVVVKEKTKENKARVLFEGPIFAQSWFRDEEPTIRFDNDNVYTF